MLYHLAPYLEQIWGPFRLFGSHAFLLACGTGLAALFVVMLLPLLWNRLPQDHGKALVADGMASRGKPTGGGLFVTLLALPIVLLFTPLTFPVVGVLVFLYAAMTFGYLDDASDVPWGRVKKGLLDVVVSVGAAACVYVGHVHAFADGGGAHVWLPLVKGIWIVPWWVYVPCAGFMLWFVMNATNCSDGVDGLAGSLTIVSLVSLAFFLYLVIGYLPAARYFRIDMGPTAARLAARWAVLLTIVAGAFAGYLWWNAEKSKVLMGDAGSRFLGLLVGVGVLMTGNPLLVFAFAPVVLVNGGTGLGKIVLLKALRKFGLDVRPTANLDAAQRAHQKPFVRALHAVRFPLHDHCKKTLGWSNAQVLMRFVLLQAFFLPILLLLMAKVR